MWSAQASRGKVEVRCGGGGGGGGCDGRAVRLEQTLDSLKVSAVSATSLLVCAFRFVLLRLRVLRFFFSVGRFPV